MKKLILFLISSLILFFPVIAQEVTEEVPEEVFTLKRGNIPQAVLKTADEFFKGATQIKWGVFPNELKSYGWVKNKNYNEPIDHYEITMNSSNGSTVDAVFESTGELIRYRTVTKNVPPPSVIMKAIINSPYKDWTIIKDTEIIKDYQNKIAEHYAVKLEKGNQKKTLYYTMDGNLLTNK
jgi:hypothetical protein